MSKPTESAVRIGPITILTLLIILCLATLSVLSLTTARASQVAAQKQDASVQAVYANEQQGQQFLADVDAVLNAQRQSGGGTAAAMSALKTRFGSDIDVSGTSVTRTFTSDSRTLTVQLEISNALTYQVTQWTSASTTDTSQQVTLWSGSGSKSK